MACSSGMLTLWQIKLRKRAGGMLKDLSFSSKGWKQLYGQQRELMAGAKATFVTSSFMTGTSNVAVFLTTPPSDLWQPAGRLARPLQCLVGLCVCFYVTWAVWLLWVVTCTSMLPSRIWLLIEIWRSCTFVNLDCCLLCFELCAGPLLPTVPFLEGLFYWRLMSIESRCSCSWSACTSL